MKSIQDENYQQFVITIKDKIRSSQYEALKAVNKRLILLYWEIGKMIVEKQEEFGWGKSVVEQISLDIQKSIPGVRGFSTQNLWYMRQFYNEYVDVPNLQPMVGEISWSKHIIIFSKCKNELERTFYIKSTKKFGWTKRVLSHQIENKTYEKYLLNQTNFDSLLSKDFQHQANLAIKDEYTFDFLELADKHSEYELEQALIKNIRGFLIEMGGDFAFIGNQYRLILEDKEYFIDLLLYHRKLQSLVAIELKIGEFEPEFKGKMEFYLTCLNERVKLPHENEAIGIIICKTKNRVVVEYALKNTQHPIGIATYTISPTLPKNYEGLLPSEAEIKERLKYLDDLK
jgi:predicted nuclease of restriction endonuclease-like (RecB) superfamily